MTEFAPVSSTGHLIIVDDMWLQTNILLGDKAAITFKIVIQLGSILAVFLVFWKRFLSLLGFNKNITSHLNLFYVVFALLPATILGLTFKDSIDKLFKIETVIVALIIGAVLMMFADKFGPKKTKVVSLDHITYKQAFMIGIIQCLSLWPGR